MGPRERDIDRTDEEERRESEGKNELVITFLTGLKPLISQPRDRLVGVGVLPVLELRPSRVTVSKLRMNWEPADTRIHSRIPLRTPPWALGMPMLPPGCP